MTHADPRKVVAEFADSMAATSRRIGEHGDASAYETLAAQTLHPADILTMARQVGQAMAARGYPEAGACVQLLAEIVDGDCPLHGEAELQGPPVDGREVDRAPEDVLTVKAVEDLRDAVAAQPVGGWPVAISPHEAAAWFGPAPRTGDGAPSAPPAAVSPVAGGPPQEPLGSGGESAPSPPHAWTRTTDGFVFRNCQCAVGEDHLGPTRDIAPPSPHRWLLADDDPRSRECRCLIGDDHVAEPRFEKES